MSGTELFEVRADDRPAPRGSLGSPFLTLLVVLCAIGAVTFGLVAANGDDFAKARIPRRPQLPGAMSVAQLREAFAGNPEMLASLPPVREVQMQVQATGLPTTALAYRMVSPTVGPLLQLATALGFPESLMNQGPFRVASTSTLHLQIRTNGGARFTTSPAEPDPCTEFEGACGFDSDSSLGGPPVASTTTTTTKRAVLPPDQRARQIVDRLSDVLLGNVAADQQPDGRWTIRVVPKVDGQVVRGWQSDIVLGPDGVLAEAIGWAGRPGQATRYPLAPLDVAIARLGSGDYFFRGFEPLSAGDAESRRLMLSPTATGPIVVTGVRVSVEIQDGGNDTFLAPVYVFTTATDGEVSVAAVTDDDLQTQRRFSFGRGGRNVPRSRPGAGP